jgi:hypothetical protein
MLIQQIRSKIFEIRGYNVMLDFELASMYEAENRALKQAVKRNSDRFPDDFMFQLTKSEWSELITNCDMLPDGIKYSPSSPFAFTEQGVAMLSSILRSKKAIEVNIAIMRAFVFLRQYALTHKDLTDRLNELEKKYNKRFKDVSDAIDYLLENDKVIEEQTNRKRIGFK